LYTRPCFVWKAAEKEWVIQGLSSDNDQDGEGQDEAQGADQDGGDQED
jgi:hypothetical protein